MNRDLCVEDREPFPSSVDASADGAAITGAVERQGEGAVRLFPWLCMIGSIGTLSTAWDVGRFLWRLPASKLANLPQ